MTVTWLDEFVDIEPQALPVMPILVLIPAHDEADRIADAVASVRGNRVVVIADNCTDATATLARRAGAEVFTTTNNIAKKAGALDQALDWYLPMWHGDVMIMDADSVVGPEFVSTATTLLSEDPYLGAVGGVFYADQPRGLIERLQANEYRRYSRVIAQKRDAVSVLTGTAAVIRRKALIDLLKWRGYIYDPTAITEDNEMTLALKTLGWKLLSPQQCTVHTAVMPSWGDLATQRLRWYRGALDNLRAYGWTPVTRKYWRQQAGLAASMLMLAAYLTYTALSVASGTLTFSPFWTGVGVLFMFERVVTVWREGIRARILAALMIPELVYDLYLQSIFLRTLWTIVARRNVRWVHPQQRKVV